MRNIKTIKLPSEENIFMTLREVKISFFLFWFFYVPRLASNLKSSYLSLLSVGITGVFHCTWPYSILSNRFRSDFVL
jgi:hypothetical protein